MDHATLQRKLAHLEEEITLAQASALQGSTPLSKVALTLDDAIRVAQNIRNRLAGALRPTTGQAYHVNRRSTETSATD